MDQEVKAEKDLSPRRRCKDVCMNTFNNYDVNDTRTKLMLPLKIQAYWLNYNVRSVAKQYMAKESI